MTTVLRYMEVYEIKHVDSTWLCPLRRHQREKATPHVMLHLITQKEEMPPPPRPPNNGV